MLRAVNRVIEAASTEVGDEQLEVLCECGRESCSELIVVSATAYDAVHSQSDRFLLVAGHETLEIERVVDDYAEYLIVEKFGEAERAADDAAKT